MKIRKLAELLVAEKYLGCLGSERTEIAVDAEVKRILARGLWDDGDMLTRLAWVEIETDHLGEPL
jgi:hypothetical protein